MAHEDEAQSNDVEQGREAFFAAVFHSLRAVIAVLDRDGTIIATNEAWNRYANELATGGGYPLRQGDNYLAACQLTMQDAGARGEDACNGIRAVLDGKSTHFTNEYSSITSNGRRWFLLNVVPLAGKPGYAIISHIDITERYEADEALRAERHQFEELANELDAILEYAQVGIATTDRDNRILRLNGRFARFLGLPREKALGQTISSITGNVTGDNLRRHVWETGEPINLAGFYYTFPKQPDRLPVYMDMTMVSIPDPEGHIDRLLTTLSDVTDYILTREQIDFERARWYAMLTTLPIPTIAIDPEGAIQVANQAAEAIAQRPLVGARFPDMAREFAFFFTPDGNPLPLEEWPAMCALRGEEVRDVELQLERVNGEFVPVLCHAAPIHSKGEIVGAVMVMQDLTKLKEADRVKDAFLATVSHDLRAPLTAIKGWAEVAGETDDLAIIRQAVEAILRSVAIQRRLVADLLDAAAIAAGSLRLVPKAQDMRPIIDEVVNRAAITALDRGVTLVSEEPSMPVEGCVDAVRVQQIVGNLVDNALKFTPRGGRVDVRLTEEDSRAVLTVHDTGRGISAEMLPHIFEPFSAAHPAASTVTGVGLGLSIVRAMVELHGGTIDVESPGEGQGSTFTVTLPTQCKS